MSLDAPCYVCVTIEQGEGGAVAGAVLAAAQRSNTPNRGGRAAAGGGTNPATPPPQSAQTPAATRREPAAANRRVPAVTAGVLSRVNRLCVLLAVQSALLPCKLIGVRPGLGGVSAST
jgi:hypothetical protein